MEAAPAYGGTHFLSALIPDLSLHSLQGHRGPVVQNARPAPPLGRPAACSVRLWVGSYLFGLFVGLVLVDSTGK